MAAGSIALLLIGASVALHVEKVDGVPKKAVKPVLFELRDAVTKVVGSKPKIDKKAGDCREDAACVSEVLARTRTDAVVFLSLFGPKKGSSENRLLLVMVRDGRSDKAGVLLPTDATERAEKLSGVVERLVAATAPPEAAPVAAAPPVVAPPPPTVTPTPTPKAAAPPTVAPARPTPSITARPAPPAPAAPAAAPAARPSPPPAAAAAPATPPPPGGTSLDTTVRPSGPSLTPWILIGAGAVAASAGTIFGLTASSARSDATSLSHDPAELDTLNDRIFSSGLTANVLFGAALVSAATGAVLLVLD